MTRDLNDTLVFVKVVEHGSFISAARALRLPKTTVSRKVQELETRLGAQLLHRTTRKLGLTEAGNVYFEHCQRIARELDEAESAVGQLQSGPRGWLRFTAPYSLGIDKIAPLLGEFHARHPEVRVEMLLSNEPLDLIDKEIDVALRVGNLPDSNLVARRLAVFRTQVYASPEYIERHGEPLHPDDLQHHRHAGDAEGAAQRHGFCWTLSDGKRDLDFRIDPVLVANDSGALKGALLCGEGLMLAADVMMKPLAEHGLRAARARRLDRPGIRVQRGVPARHDAVAEGARLRRLPGRTPELRRGLHAGALPDLPAPAGTAGQGAAAGCPTKKKRPPAAAEAESGKAEEEDLRSLCEERVAAEGVPTSLRPLRWPRSMQMRFILEWKPLLLAGRLADRLASMSRGGTDRLQQRRIDGATGKAHPVRRVPDAT